MSLNKYLRKARKKVEVTADMLQAMFTELEMLHVEYKFYEINGILNIYLNPFDRDGTIVSFYTTKDFANCYSDSKVVATMDGWRNTLAFVRDNIASRV